MTKGLPALAVLVSAWVWGLAVSSAQQTTPAAPGRTVFTAVQAEAGRVVCNNSCVYCHTETLGGRTGAANEVPRLDSLAFDAQRFIRDHGGKVPPLVGPKFIERFGWQTTGDLARRFAETMEGFALPDRGEKTLFALTAYVLQMNGARAGMEELGSPGTMDVEIQTITTGIPPSNTNPQNR